MLADDAVLVRTGLARVLEERGCEVVAQSGDVAGIVAAVRADRPDLVVLDLRMPPGFAAEGIEAAEQIRALAPDLGLVVLSQYVEAHHALRLMEDFHHGVGYLLKDRVSDLGGFVHDLRRVASGEVVIDAELVARLVARRRPADPLGVLTDRERGVLALMAQGRSNAALSAELHLSVKTVEAHVRAIFTKLALAPDDRDHRRVLAVLTYLRS